MEGDAQKEMVLTEARALVVREYLVENFGFDDSQLRTLGMGKQAEANSDTGWGTVQIFVYPSGLKFHRPKEHKRLCRLPNQVGSIGSSFNCHYPEAEVGVTSECFSPSECLHKARLTTEACLYDRRPTLSFSHEKRHDSERPEHDVVNRCRHRVSGSEILPDRQVLKPKHKTEFRDQHETESKAPHPEPRCGRGRHRQTKNDPPSCHNRRREHERRLHEFGRSCAEPRDNQQRANGSQHETCSEHEREIECACFHCLHAASPVTSILRRVF